MSVSVAVAVGSAVASAIAGFVLASAAALAITKFKREKAEHELEYKRRGQIHDQKWDYTVDSMCRYTYKRLDPGVFASLERDLSVGIGQWVHFHVADIEPLPRVGGEFRIPDPLDTTEFKRLAGDVEDWERQLCSGNLESTIEAFVGRVLVARMDPMGDPETSFLPQDMMRTYQDISKIKDTDICLLSTWQHLWRTLTVRWSEHKFPLDKLPENDPRWANIIATEEMLIRILAPFNGLSPDKINSDASRKYLRTITTSAAILALVMFKDPELQEFVWPEGYPEEGDDRHIVTFPGIQTPSHVPGSRMARMPGRFKIFNITKPTKSFRKLSTGYNWETIKIRRIPVGGSADSVDLVSSSEVTA